MIPQMKLSVKSPGIPARISEMSSQGSNRREEYKKVARIFHECRDIQQAHRLAAVVFGIEKPFHLKGNLQRETDSINSGVYEEDPGVITLTPRIRTYREKAKRTGIRDHSKEKEEMRASEIKKLEQERKLLKSYIKDNRLEFASLPEIEPQVRIFFFYGCQKHWKGRSTGQRRKKARFITLNRRSAGILYSELYGRHFSDALPIP